MKSTLDRANTAYWRTFNFLIRRVFAIGSISAGIVLAIVDIPALLPDGTVNVDGVPTSDLVFRLLSVAVPLLFVIIGLALFRVKPYYPGDTDRVE